MVHDFKTVRKSVFCILKVWTNKFKEEQKWIPNLTMLQTFIIFVKWKSNGSLSSRGDLIGSEWKERKVAFCCQTSKDDLSMTNRKCENNSTQLNSTHFTWSYSYKTFTTSSCKSIYYKTELCKFWHN